MRALALFLLVTLWGLPATAADCRTVTFADNDYSICEVDLTREKLALFLYDANGEPYGHFSKLDKALSENGMSLGFAMNAGMYHEDRAPVGHYVEEGRELQRVIREKRAL